MMEEIKKIDNDDLEKISGGISKGWYEGECFRCGRSDTTNYCNYKWYGQICCKECYNVLSAREEKYYSMNGNEILNQLKLLESKIDNIKKIK